MQITSRIQTQATFNGYNLQPVHTYVQEENKKKIKKRATITAQVVDIATRDQQ